MGVVLRHKWTRNSYNHNLATAQADPQQATELPASFTVTCQEPRPDRSVVTWQARRIAYKVSKPINTRP